MTLGSGVDREAVPGANRLSQEGDGKPDITDNR